MEVLISKIKAMFPSAYEVQLNPVHAFHQRRGFMYTYGIELKYMGSIQPNIMQVMVRTGAFLTVNDRLVTAYFDDDIRFVKDGNTFYYE